MGNQTFYVAADFARRDEVNKLCRRIEELTLWDSVTGWADREPEFTESGAGLSGVMEPDKAIAEMVAMTDLDDVRRADTFIQLATGEKTRGGRHVELGYALAVNRTWRKTRIVLQGPRETVFHHYPWANHFDDIEPMLEWLTFCARS